MSYLELTLKAFCNTYSYDKMLPSKYIFTIFNHRKELCKKILEYYSIIITSQTIQNKECWYQRYFVDSNILYFRACHFGSAFKGENYSV